MPDASVIEETALIRKASRQIDEYLKGDRKIFDLPIFAVGTPFQQMVWEALKTIPYGETRSYKDIAVQIGKAKACRAVGMANNRNPIAIIIPCHRVIGSKGALVGYGGGLDIKKHLLGLEGKKIVGDKIIS
ncbi:MAG: methylated-DNA--[protein]-cysteine S-methyltransferase [Clostridiaceae bacterium]|nr:methylated-DNA--[protein]-cysteine S-methyltransferase [Clostridiaceae bacterium]